MTPGSASSAPAELAFQRGEDGRWRCGGYTLSPGTVGFGIEVMEIFRGGLHVHRTAGPRCLPDAIAWAQRDAGVVAATATD